MNASQRAMLIAGLLFAAIALPVLAATSPQWEVAGAITGAPGGGTERYDVDFPASTHVTLTLNHAPCQQPEDAVVVKAYGPHGEYAGTRTTESCDRQLVFYTIGGGTGHIDVQNFVPDLALQYTLTSEGVALPGGAPPEGGPQPDPATIPRAPTTASGTLQGTTGGATVDVTAVAGAPLPHTIAMTYTMASGGGTWDGVGFKVTSAADGSVLATSSETTPGTHSASFVPTPNMNLRIEVFNYNNGQSMNYGLSGLPAGEEG